MTTYRPAKQAHAAGNLTPLKETSKTLAGALRQANRRNLRLGAATHIAAYQNFKRVQVWTIAEAVTQVEANRAAASTERAEDRAMGAAPVAIVKESPAAPDTIQTADLALGTYLIIGYGNGTQVFFVTRVTPKGKPFGLRLYGRSNDGGGVWDTSSLKVNDGRIEKVLDARPVDVPAPLALDQAPRSIARLEAQLVRELERHPGTYLRGTEKMIADWKTTVAEIQAIETTRRPS